MANYIASCRTNYFKVKDPQAFIEAMRKVPDIEVIQKDEDFVLLGTNPNGGGWPSWVYDHDTGDEYQIDLAGMVAGHLTEDSVAVFMEVGAEKLRCLTGYAVAVNHKDEHVTIDLDGIYSLAEQKFDLPHGSVSTATY